MHTAARHLIAQTADEKLSIFYGIESLLELMRESLRVGIFKSVPQRFLIMEVMMDARHPHTHSSDRSALPNEASPTVRTSVSDYKLTNSISFRDSHIPLSLSHTS
jgi:hypothetical protein